jgi:putative hydrolase of the HAD superfamily
VLRAVLFDLGNVVTFFDHDRACRALATLGRDGLGADDVRERVFASGLELDFDCGRIDTAAFVARLKDVCGISAPDEDVARAWADIFTPNEPVWQLVPRLRRAGLTLVLASNTNALHFDWLRRHYAAPLSSMHAFALSYELGVVKPDAAFFEAGLRIASATPAETLFVDDKPAYVEAARALGLSAEVYTPAVDLSAIVEDLGVRLEG